MASFESDRSPRQSGQSTATTEKSELGTVEVEIQGRTLSLKSDRPPEFVRRIASHVDETLAELKRAAPGASNEKLLMMTGLTIAEELFEARRDLEELRGDLQERTETMRQIISQFEQQV